MMKFIFLFKFKKLIFSVGLLFLVLFYVYVVDFFVVFVIDVKVYVLMDYNSGKVLVEGNSD